MRVRLLSLRLDVLHQRLLLHDDSVEVLKQLVQLHHRALNLDNRVVSLPHIAQSRLRLPSAIGVQKRLLENLLIASGFSGLLQLLLCRIWSYDEVLPSLLLLYLSPELRLGLLESVDAP